MRLFRSGATRAVRRPLVAAVALAVVAAWASPAAAQSVFPEPPSNVIITPVDPRAVQTGDAPATPAVRSTEVTPLGWYALGTVACAAASPIIGTLVLNRELLPREVVTSTLTCFLGPLGWIIAQQAFPPDVRAPIDPGQPSRWPSPPTGPGPPVAQSGTASQQASRLGFDQPVRGAAFVPKEVVLLTDPGTDAQALNAIARRLRMSEREAFESTLTGRQYHRWHIDSNATVGSMIRSLSRQSIVAAAQPNYLYRLQQDRGGDAKGDPDQYAIGKLRLPEAHRSATGNGVKIAVIDSEVDAEHPDLAGAIAASLDSTGAQDQPHPHGTGMAGAIASHSRLLGVAPRASLLAVRAFAASSGGADGTTFRIVKGLDWAAKQGARIVNMSFAGPSDPAVRGGLEAATERDIVLIAAAGNEGPRSLPLFPASDANVIAVTATDVEDGLFPQANRGAHVAVAAPGVDVLVPAPNRGYQLTSGTSVATAEVSGVAALILERNPALKPRDIRKILMSSAHHLGPPGRNPEFGAGLVDPVEALEMAPRGLSQAQ